MGCAYFAILAIKRNEPRYWLWFGVVAGLGLEEKYSIAVFGLGIVVGMLLTEQRRVFLNKWIWLGGLAAFLIFLPNLLWNIRHDWPFVQLMRAIRAEGRDVVLGPFPYFFQQTLLVNPLTAPIWLAGLFALLFSARLQPYRVLGWCYLVCYAVFFFLHGKNYYLAPIYPMLLAAGAVVIESAIRWRENARAPPPMAQNRPSHLSCWPAAHILLRSWCRCFLLTGSSPTRNISPSSFPSWNTPTPGPRCPSGTPTSSAGKKSPTKLLSPGIASPPSERHDCGIFAQDYGQAGAIDFLGRRDGLPPALSGHQTWFLWGPRGYSGNCMIVLDDRREVLERLWEHVDYVGTSADNPYALEKQIDVFLCKGAKFGTLAQLWPKLKRWR